MNIKIILLCMVCFLPVLAQASEKASLEQCMVWAVAQSPQNEEYQAKTAAARALLAKVEAAHLPQGELKVLVAPTAQAKGQPGNAPGYSSGKLRGVTDWEYGTLTIIQPIYTFGKLTAYKEAATAGIAVAEAQQRIQDMSVAELTATAYQSYLLAKTALKLTKFVDGLIGTAIDRNQRLQEGGMDDINPIDILRMQSVRGLILQRKYQAESGLLFTKQALKTLTGHDVRPKERKLSLLSVPQHDLAAWVDIARHERPEFTMAKEGLKARQKLVEVAKASLYPDFFLIGMLSAAHSTGRDRIIDPFIQDPFNHFYGTIGLGMRWAFDLGIKSADVDKAKAEHAEVVAKSRFADEMIPVQVSQGYHNLTSLAKQVKALKSSSRSGKQWLIMAASNYDIGLGTAKDMSDALTAYVMAEASYLVAMHEHNMAAVHLLQNVGQLQTQ
ncbi:MAG: TolC family protein [Mariprofundales bacterium]